MNSAWFTVRHERQKKKRKKKGLLLTSGMLGNIVLPDILWISGSQLVDLGRGRCLEDPSNFSNFLTSAELKKAAVLELSGHG